MTRPRAAFLDRDGVINQDRGYVYRIEDFVLLPSAIDGLRTLQGAGFLLVVVTNQSGIARGMYTEQDYRVLTDYMRALMNRNAIVLSGIYHCPHHPARGTTSASQLECECRKPKPGLLFQAQIDLNIDLSRSILIGDNASDIEAGRAASLGACVLVNSHPELGNMHTSAADAYCANLGDAADWIVSHD